VTVENETETSWKFQIKNVCEAVLYVYPGTRVCSIMILVQGVQMCSARYGTDLLVSVFGSQYISCPVSLKSSQGG
jgi:hypothetical protein